MRLDIAGGYWDKLSLTPAHRSSLVVGNLFGEMFAVLGYSLVLLLFGFAIGVRFAENPVIGSLDAQRRCCSGSGSPPSASPSPWPPAGSVEDTQSTFIIFFPLLFLTPSALRGT